MTAYTKYRFQKLAGLLREQVEDNADQQQQVAQPDQQQQTQPADDRKTIFVLVGPPSVGKSTWIQSAFEEKPYIINRDDIVDSVSSQMGWTYDDMFVTPPADAVVGESDEKYGEVQKAPGWMTWSPMVFSKVMGANNQVQSQFESRVGGAAGADKDIVVDMTNMNAGSRKSALKAVSGGNFKKVAVVFEFKGAEDVIQKVAQKRAEAAQRMGKSKTIPATAFQRMFQSFSQPTTGEGFDEIVSVDNRDMLRKLANDDASVNENKGPRRLREDRTQAIKELKDKLNRQKQVLARLSRHNADIQASGDLYQIDMNNDNMSHEMNLTSKIEANETLLSQLIAKGDQPTARERKTPGVKQVSERLINTQLTKLIREAVKEAVAGVLKEQMGSSRLPKPRKLVGGLAKKISRNYDPDKAVGLGNERLDDEVWDEY